MLLARTIALALLALAPVALHAQADTVWAGVAARSALTLALGVDSSDIYATRGGERRHMVTYIEETSRTRDGYLIVGRNVRPDGVILSLDSVIVAAGTLAPLSHADSTPSGRTSVRFVAGRMRGTLVDSSGRRHDIDSVVPAGVYDYSIGSLIVNLLPLRAGYSAVLPSYDIHRGSQFTRVTVLAAEEIESRGRREPAWKVEMDYGRFKATRWIHRDTRKDLRTVTGNAGMEMVVEYR